MLMLLASPGASRAGVLLGRLTMGEGEAKIGAL